ncbi:MAG: protein-L-isoaspartate(D-aspartate) O-methyltransferase [Thermoprotei archaeon]
MNKSLFKPIDPAYLRVKMVERLIKKGYIKSDHVKKALLEVPREKFVNQAVSRAYSDKPIPIGFGQTVSAPHMVAFILEELELKGGLKVLEVGTGSGYHAAVTYKALEVLGGGELYTIEIDERLYRIAQKNLENLGFTLIHVVLGDGFAGLPDFSPFDRIYVTAATPEKPKPLYAQLAPQGILIFPFGPPNQVQQLLKVRRKPDGFAEEHLMDVAFVPLKRWGERGQPP